MLANAHLQHDLDQSRKTVIAKMLSKKNTIQNLLLQQAKEHPERVWLKDLSADSDTRWTWGEALEEIHALAFWLQSVTQGKGNNISILSRNRAHWVLADMAIIAANNVSVPIFTTQSQSIASYIFDLTDVQVLFVGESENWEKIQPVIPKDTIVVTFPGVEVNVPSLKWGDLVKQFQGKSVSVSTSPEDMISIIFTSGTTGMPKGVMQSHESMLLPVTRHAPELGISQNPRLISYLPLSHIAERQAIEIHSLLLGGEISFVESLPNLVRDLQRTQPHFFFGAPRVWETLQHGVYNFFGGRDNYAKSLKINKNAMRDDVRAMLGFNEIDAALSGAAPLSTSILNFFDELDIPILEAFGQTEAMSVISNKMNDRKVGSIGKPIGEVEARISESGELLIRSLGFALGYYKHADETAKTFVDGWLHTGDRARVDADGFYFLTGRVKDYFKTIQGKYVAPAPIEDKLSGSPYIEQMALIGRGCSSTCLICVPSVEGFGLSTEALSEALLSLVQSVNDKLEEKHARIGVVLVSDQAWTVDNEFLTTTLKLKRNKVEDTFLKIVEPLAKQAVVHKEVLIEFYHNDNCKSKD